MEEFVKRYVLREGAKVNVKTQTHDPRKKLGDNKVWYLAPTLEYTYHSQTLNTNKNTHHYVSNIMIYNFEGPVIHNLTGP